FEVYAYKNLPGDLSSLVIERNTFLLKHFKMMIQRKERQLMSRFEIFDLENNGTIRTDLWADIVSKAFNSEISVRHLKAIKDFLCECETNLDCVNYRSLFRKGGHVRSSEEKQFLDLVTNLFEILDRNNDKKISVTEARYALDVINQNLGTKFLVQKDCFNFIKQMDKNGDNHVDLDEFMQAFMESEYLKDDQDLCDSEDSDNSDVQIFKL
ncbi:ATP-dependent DNA helicase, partial [Brachionus plicatilis]